MSGNEGATVFQASSLAGLLRSAKSLHQIDGVVSQTPCCPKRLLLVLVGTGAVDTGGGDHSGVDRCPDGLHLPNPMPSNHNSAS